jgi:hypothetical protein
MRLRKWAHGGLHRRIGKGALVQHAGAKLRQILNPCQALVHLCPLDQHWEEADHRIGWSAFTQTFIPSAQLFQGEIQLERTRNTFTTVDFQPRGQRRGSKLSGTTLDRPLCLFFKFARKWSLFDDSHFHLTYPLVQPRVARSQAPRRASLPSRLHHSEPIHSCHHLSS